MDINYTCHNKSLHRCRFFTSYFAFSDHFKRFRLTRTSVLMKKKNFFLCTANVAVYQYATKINRNIPHLVSISTRYYYDYLAQLFSKEDMQIFHKVDGQIKRVMPTYDSFLKYTSIDLSFW